MIILKNIKYLTLSIVVFFAACEPFVEDGIGLPPQPDAPTFVIESTDNPNKKVIKFNEDGYFDHIWGMPGGIPNSSTLRTDTVFYVNAGTYDITLHASAVGGGGASSSTQSVVIDEDAAIECNDDLTLLTDECTSKCWKLSTDAGSITLGPEPLSSEWFSSTGLDGAQIDDLWCFDFEGAAFRYENNGNTFSACANYSVVEDYTIPANMIYSVVPSNSLFSDLKIVLPDGFWMGIEDSGNEYEIVDLTEDQMILVTPLTPCDNSPSTGYFTLIFLAE